MKGFDLFFVPKPFGNSTSSQDIRGLELWAKPEESNQLRMGPMELYALDD